MRKSSPKKKRTPSHTQILQLQIELNKFCWSAHAAATNGRKRYITFYFILFHFHITQRERLFCAFVWYVKKNKLFHYMCFSGGVVVWSACLIIKAGGQSGLEPDGCGKKQPKRTTATTSHHHYMSIPNMEHAKSRNNKIEINYSVSKLYI